MSRALLAALLLLTGAALALRLPELSLRPMHNDEGVNALKFRDLWVNNNYKYDPNEFHGPTLPYATLPSALLAGGGDFNQFSEKTFRCVTVFFGAGLVLLLALVATDLGKTETLWAALWTVISPAMVFYSRYYIHEMLLVFFTAFTFFCLWRGGKFWVITAGVGLGLMAATKETFIFTGVALVLSVVSTRLLSRSATSFNPQWKYGAIALFVAAVVAALFFSSFFTNASGPLDAMRTYLPWGKRAGGQSIHAHPWNFYFQRLLAFHSPGGPFWSEGLIAGLGVMGFIFAMRDRRPLWLLIAFYTLWLTIIYTALSYKTPWCLLGFYHGVILLAGLGAAGLLRLFRPAWVRIVCGVLLLAGAAQLSGQTWRENFGFDSNGTPWCDSAKNPYVYSQTSPDILRLMSTLDGLAHEDTVIEVVSPDSYWPLPWYLRRFKNVGFFEELPQQPLAPIMIVNASLHAALDDRKPRTHLMAGYFQLRPNVFLELYVNIDLWSAYVKTLPPEKD
jgi:uncharacterized protein (TIGR03663 family)